MTTDKRLTSKTEMRQTRLFEIYFSVARTQHTQV